ncbi:hypothetical protein LOD99_9854 [Oopsacas minuta]|uniref:Transposase n=1 Tax=Oopsacas minuta TaxID=111878 RepID=A0AAV7KK49_9METZ|nr:hypothetical protein LOD99_9854 [Oopsacas minuta]
MALISVSAPVVTGKGSNMVAGLRDAPRIDCACHRLRTVFNEAYKETQNQCPKFKEYEEAACILCKHVKQATGIQETLPVSIKHGKIHVHGHPSTAVHTALTKAT